MHRHIDIYFLLLCSSKKMTKYVDEKYYFPICFSQYVSLHWYRTAYKCYAYEQWVITWLILYFSYMGFLNFILGEFIGSRDSLPYKIPIFFSGLSFSTCSTIWRNSFNNSYSSRPLYYCFFACMYVTVWPLLLYISYTYKKKRRRWHKILSCWKVSTITLIRHNIR